MIDWHSHVLPKMDDGARDVDESVELLRELKAQGVSTVVATPHFYANDETPQSFLERRDVSYEALSGSLSEDMPRVLLGAEVAFYSGISRMEDLRSLCIEGTRILLVEMPFVRWTEYMISELVELALGGGVAVMLAHVERYIGMQEDGVFERLLEAGVIMQANASFFIRFFTKRSAIKMLSRGFIKVMGSDTHNSSSRPPRLKEAYSYVKKRLNDEFIRDMNEYGNYLLAKYSV